MAHIRSILAQLFALWRIALCASTHDEEPHSQYQNYEALSLRLQRLAEKHPHICSLVSAGRSAEARELWVMRIAASTRNISDLPRFRYVGNIHGDDMLSRQLLIYLIDYLLTHYGADPRVTDLIDNTDIYIIPSVNPDGLEKAVEGDCYGHDHFDPSAVESAPEMSAVTNWCLQKKFVLSGILLGGSLEANYHFDSSISHSDDDDDDDDLFCYLAQTFTENQLRKSQCPADLNKKFRNGTTTTWTEGCIHEISRFSGDCIEVTLQLSCCKYPLASDLYSEWNNNREALLAYMEKVHIGLRGYVKTSSGMGILGSNISVTGMDHVTTTGMFGDYYRLLLPGTYTITASSYGYLPSTVNNVTVTEGRATPLNFTLMDLSEAVLMPKLFTTAAYQSTEQVLDTQQASTSDSLVQKQDFSHFSYSDMEVFLKQMSSVYPSLAQLYSIGQSVLGRELYVMKISFNLESDEGKPEIVFLHSSGSVGQGILLNLVECLCSNYGSEPSITQLLNSTRVHILPNRNPDGEEIPEKAFHVNSEFGSGVKSGDGQNADSSGNFPDQIHSADYVQPETKAVMKWIAAHSFVLSASILGGGIGVMYPGSADSIDEAVFKSISQAYSEFSSLQLPQTCEDPGHLDRNKINPGAPTEIGLEDWMYRNTDTLGVGVGVSCDLRPPVENITAYWRQNRRSLLHLIQQVHFSVRGSVTDSHSGQAITNATIEVHGSRHRVHTSRTGEYWRPLSPGTYQLHASAPGYFPLSAPVTVTEFQGEQVDFVLTRDLQPKPQNLSEDEEFLRLVENLSSSNGLKQLVQNYPTARTLQYRKHTERSEFLRGLHLNFPQITRLYSLGNSWKFRPIWALEISASPESTQYVTPKIRYVAGVHGNAAAGPELLIEFASVLCMNYGGNPAITNLIDRSRIVIVPCVNPDGRELAREGSCFSMEGLCNAHGVDLDTDFMSGNTSAQPETRAMADLIEGGRFSLSVALDGGSLLTTYPYDRTGEAAHSEETLRYLASVYASTHPIMHLGYPGCRNGLDSVQGGVLRGAAFRSHLGSMKDFSVDVGLCPEITVYTGCCLYPPAQQLLPLWAEHRTALFAMLLEIHKGLSGLVKDEDGWPVADAAIKLNGSVFTRTDAQGFFHTLLAPGTQQLQVQAPGFHEELMQVNVSSHQRTVPITIKMKFWKKSGHQGQGLALAAAITIIAILLCLLLMWHIRSVKFSRIRDFVRRLRHLQEDAQTGASASEKLPLQSMFLEDTSESEDDAFYLERH
ncbi:carboxypeptidase D, b isoform X1 [Silurus meridionalis]|uniref:carboxypeptidase D, b isoform X1 n=1 Tax=Silurus meridionalis TaxID=175797 RepID=UPI001EEC976A|nr:carboxypeptidase D, b isoform X1 [Silurus meridionalis]